MKKDGNKFTTAINKVISRFNLQKGEKLALVTDDAVDPRIQEAIRYVGDRYGAKVIITEPSKYSAQPFSDEVNQQLRQAQAIAYFTSSSRTHSPITSELLRNKQARFYSITNTTPEVLLKGAATEKGSKLWKRMWQASFLKDAVGFYIHSRNGTNLHIGVSGKRVIQDTGRVYRPGVMANFPTGEIMSAVDLKDSYGTAVIDGVIEGVGQVDKPIKLKIEHGKITDIQGGESAEKLKELLEKTETAYKQKNPEGRGSAYSLAEIGFGTNPKAIRGYGEKRQAAKTLIEAEKGLGTYHIAVGNNRAFGVKPEDPDYNEIPIHLDMVELHPTVEVEMKDGKKLEIITNGNPRFRQAKKDLEGKMSHLLIIAPIISLLLSMLFSLINITGFAIKIEENTVKSSGAVFFIIGLILTLIYLKRKSNLSAVNYSVFDFASDPF